MTPPYLSVIVPAYNEQARIQATLVGLAEYYARQSYTWEVTVVSDGSTDDTNKVVEQFCEGNPAFRLRAYDKNRGKGYAVRTGMLAAEGELLLFCDADMATPQEETEKLLAAIANGADVAIGSRPLAASRLERHQPPLREAFGRAANLLVRILAVRDIYDTQCGFKMFRREAAREVFSRCQLDGFSFDFETLMIAKDLGLRIDEIPIRWAHQEGSKVVFWRDYPRALKDLVGLRLRGRQSRLRRMPAPLREES